jgi:SpoVK/Ycf46/Vps4 family AAA+-type ATPase
MARAPQAPHVLQALPFGDKGPLLVEIRPENQRTFTDLHLADGTRALLQRLVDEHRCADKLRKATLHPVNRCLFFGPPGCGKNSAAGAVAQALDVPLVTVRNDVLMGQYVGTTGNNLRIVFEYAKANHVVILLDEVDGLMRRRSNDDQGVAIEHNRVVNAALTMLEEARDWPSIIIAASNHVGLLDAAAWRRFDEVISFPGPTPQEGRALLGAILARHGQQPVLWRWPTWLREASYADIERIALDAVKDVIIGSEATIDRALRAAAERQRARREFAESDVPRESRR